MECGRYVRRIVVDTLVIDQMFRGICEPLPASLPLFLKRLEFQNLDNDFSGSVKLSPLGFGFRLSSDSSLQQTSQS
jgi:hypothetical protein